MPSPAPTAPAGALGYRSVRIRGVRTGVWFDPVWVTLGVTQLQVQVVGAGAGAVDSQRGDDRPADSGEQHVVRHRPFAHHSGGLRLVAFAAAYRTYESAPSGSSEYRPSDRVALRPG
ncbi:hypothetical protein [Streptomyces sp. NPDC101455]|uniref:hypothetical protein n=1 Tax=Streptomyces sp. NPDC101455 TaxID=3366142 RepID=UPI00382BD1BB